MARESWKITKVEVSMWSQCENGIREIMLIATTKENKETGEIKEFFRMNGGLLPDMLQLVGDFEVWGGREEIRRWLVSKGFISNGYFETETIQ